MFIFKTTSKTKNENNFVSTTTPPSLSNDITLVTQTSSDDYRLQRLKWLIERWNGPISVAVCVPHRSGGRANPRLQGLEQYLRQQGRSHNVKVTVYETYHEDDVFPINFLRNLAISQSTTEFIFYLDVDFIPNVDAYENLKNSRHELELVKHKKALLVLPAFDLMEESPHDVKYKNDILRKEKEEKAEQFHKYWKPAHHRTNYKRWRKTSKPYKINYQLHFEPYFVIHRSSPLYDELFVGYGLNKESQVYELWSRNFTFYVMPNDFVFHLKHEYSQKKRSRLIWSENNERFNKMKERLKEETGKILN